MAGCVKAQAKDMLMNIELNGVEVAHWATSAKQEIYPGVIKRELWRGKGGSKALILEFAPGARFTELDVHAPGPEEVFVVSGTFSDGVHTFEAGSFIHNPVGSAHLPQSSAGCVLFVFFPQG